MNALIERVRSELMAIPGVIWVGRGVTEGCHCVRVGVREGHGYIPPTIEGFIVELFYETAHPRLHMTVLPGGSIGAKGNYWASAGSMGFFVKANGDLFLLTASHLWKAHMGDAMAPPLYSPAPYRGGTEIGTLVRRETPGMDFNVDAAAVLLHPAVGISPYIKETANTVALRRLVQPEIGMTVYKRGQTTGITRGIIREVAVSVDFGDGWLCEKGFWVDSPSQFSAEGDSGGIVYTANGGVVGMITGGTSGGINDRAYCTGAMDALNELGLIGATLVNPDEYPLPDRQPDTNGPLPPLDLMAAGAGLVLYSGLLFMGYRLLTNRRSERRVIV